MKQTKRSKAYRLVTEFPRRFVGKKAKEDLSDCTVDSVEKDGLKIGGAKSRELRNATDPRLRFARIALDELLGEIPSRNGQNGTSHRGFRSVCMTISCSMRDSQVDQRTSSIRNLQA